MSMFCYQCQEAAKNEGCTVVGVCGKKEDTAHLQDLLIYICKGISVLAEEAEAMGKLDDKVGLFIAKSLFATITNANFDNDRFYELIEDAFALRDELQQITNSKSNLDCVTWKGDKSDYLTKAASVGVLSTENEDIRSLRELIIYGLKGLAAYAEHAAMLNYEDHEIYAYIVHAMAVTCKDLTVDELISEVLKCGEYGVKTMALLDKANTSTYGSPEITEVNLGVRNNPGILISGHDCSIRLWNLDSKTCVQEITSHRKKFDESIHDVAFHPSKPYIASAGADALAKVFV